MKLEKLVINGNFKNLEKLAIDFTDRKGLTVLIGNNGSGKSNIIEAISSIFAGLYNSKYNPTFAYELSYEKDTYKVQVIFNGKDYSFTVNGKTDNIKELYLPSRIISSYSGEESRLWLNYYEPFYKDYIKAVMGATAPNQFFIFINKYYWNIALLTFYFYDFDVFTDIRDFCKNTLKIDTLNTVKFEFDTKKINSWTENPVVYFVKTLNPDNKKEIEITIDELKARLSYLTNQLDFFRYLTAAFMPKDDKLITNIQINFNSNLTVESLSEGEKKLLLVKLILEVLGDENSLILLDEPDSHLHISRKEDLKSLFLRYTNRDNVITTHSPTLTHCFDLNHIAMLTKDDNDNVKIEDKAKQHIISELTKDIWTYQQQNIFLNSSKDLIITEGPTDVIYIKTALAKLKVKDPKYNSLDFEFISANGASAIEGFIGKFVPLKKQIIIAFLDRDDDGRKSAKKILNKEIDLRTFNYEKVSDVYLAMYPITNGWNCDQFVVEDYFSNNLIGDEALNLLLSHLGSNTFRNIPNVRDKIKEKLPLKVESLGVDEFVGFEKLFDLMLTIKQL